MKAIVFFSLNKLLCFIDANQILLDLVCKGRTKPLVP